MNKKIKLPKGEPAKLRVKVTPVVPQKRTGPQRFKTKSCCG